MSKGQHKGGRGWVFCDRCGIVREVRLKEGLDDGDDINTWSWCQRRGRGGVGRQDGGFQGSKAYPGVEDW